MRQKTSSTLMTMISSFALLLLNALPTLANDFSQDYWTVEQYLTEFPKQQEKSAQFTLTVRQPGQVETLDAAKKVKILVVYPGLQASDYWRRSVAAFEARMKELQISYEIASHFTRPGNVDLRRQATQIRKALQNRPDYFIFTLDALRHKSMIEKVMAARETKIILQNITTPIRSFRSSQPFLYVGFDHKIGTKLLAERYLEETAKKANYAIFYGTRGYVSTLRGGTFLDEMSKHPGMSLKASYYVHFDREKSYTAAKEVIAEYPDLDFIYASSTDIALGITDAVNELGLSGKIKTNGWGGGSAELDAIAAGNIEFTVMRMNDDNGVAMAEAIKLDLANREEEVPTIYSGDFTLVDRHTSQDKLKRLKNRAFRYSN
ncbi:MAG: substrate-binding domain-containing protein [Sneathiella sp.]